MRRRQIALCISLLVGCNFAIAADTTSPVEDILKIELARVKGKLAEFDRMQKLCADWMQSGFTTADQKKRPELYKFDPMVYEKAEKIQQDKIASVYKKYEKHAACMKFASTIEKNGCLVIDSNPAKVAGKGTQGNHCKLPGDKFRPLTQVETLLREECPASSEFESLERHSDLVREGLVKDKLDAWKAAQSKAANIEIEIARIGNQLATERLNGKLLGRDIEVISFCNNEDKMLTDTEKNIIAELNTLKADLQKQREMVDCSTQTKSVTTPSPTSKSAGTKPADAVKAE